MSNMEPVALYVRPFACSHEGLLGYLLRLGLSNGIQKRKHMIELLGLGTAFQRTVGSWESTDQQDVFNVISAAIGRCDVSAFETVENDARRFPSSDRAMIGSTRIAEPRVCLKCMQSEQAHLPWFWQSIFVSHCPVHRTQLISNCPNHECGHHLGWEPALLEGCPQCGMKWKEMNRGYQLMTPTSNLEHRVVNDLINGADADIDFYQDLTRAMMLVARSFDFMSEKLPQVPGSPDISKIVNAAYWLITSVNFEVFYKNVKYHELGRIAVFENQQIPSLNDFYFQSELAQRAYGSEEIEPQTYATILQFDDPAFLSKRRQQSCQHDMDQVTCPRHLIQPASSNVVGC